MNQNQPRDTAEGRVEPRAEVRLPPEHRYRLERWAAEGYPHEVCGLLTGRVAGAVMEVVRVTLARNLRTDRPGDRFELAPQDLAAEDRRARAEGLQILGFWHTHPDRPARPSRTDLATAWPGYIYLIASTGAGGVADLTGWSLGDEGFAELTLRGAA